MNAPPATSPLSFIRPIDAPYTDLFGPRGARFYTGLDFPAPHGTPVVAARTGRVTVARRLAGYGFTIVIRHTLGVSTLYAHLSAFVVKDGEAVAAGQPIGRVGASGSPQRDRTCTSRCACAEQRSTRWALMR